MAQITIARGLHELKNLEDRIGKAIAALNLVGISTGNDPVIGFKTNDDFVAKAKADYQSLQALIARRAAIKAAIVVSNATTPINVAGEQMMVAEAIERKGAYVQHLRNLQNRMVHQYNQAQGRIEREIEALKPRLDQYILGLLGKDLKGKDDAVKTTTETFMETNKPKLIDPLSLQEKIETLAKEISDFVLEVDFALDESNTITKIEVPEN